MELGPPQIVVGLVAAQRLLELLHARRNARSLLLKGGVEHGARHYPLLVGLHAAWLAALFVTVPADAPVSWWLLGFFLLLQVGRVWTIASLGPYWTTRVIVVPGMKRVRSGPYRYYRHPNYLIVVLEIACLPLVFGAWWIALVFTVFNAAVLWWRIRVENAALKEGAA